MADEMLNSGKAYKGSGIQGIGDTVKLYDEYDMNKLNDSIKANDRGSKEPSKYNKNS